MRQGSIHLFRLFGIDVYLSWLWFLAAAYIASSAQGYSSLIWGVPECLALFLIVLIHEFGHQLACRQVGGKTHDIILWPFGGVAFVTPPERPGAQLWSIAAGPLVNVALFPILTWLMLLTWHFDWVSHYPDAATFVQNVWQINLLLLAFNMLPVYPLDGGQIFRSLLWFVIGRANSLLVASIVGFVGIAGLALLAIWFYFRLSDESNAIWLGAITVFLFMNCWSGLKYALALSRVAKLPRRAGLTCPSCKASPPVGTYWRCSKCGQPFDMFATFGTCPHCQAQYHKSYCLDCGTAHSLTEWGQVAPPV